MDDLQVKKCPFCGSDDIQVNKCTMRVRCKNCFATGPLISKYLKDGVTEVQAAIIAWNERSIKQ